MVYEWVTKGAFVLYAGRDEYKQTGQVLRLNLSLPWMFGTHWITMYLVVHNDVTCIHG